MCRSGAMSIVLSQLKRLNLVIKKQFFLEILFKRMSCCPCFIGCAALFLLGFQLVSVFT